MKKIKLLFLAVILSFATTTFGQQFSVGGDIGYSMPIGSIYTQSFYGEEMKYASNGMDFGIGVMYYPKFLKSHIGIGFLYNFTNIFFDDTERTYSIENYSIDLIAIKAKMSLFTIGSNFNVFAAIDIGKGFYRLPSQSDKDWYLVFNNFKGSLETNLSFCPSVEIEYLGFYLKTMYYVPVFLETSGFYDEIFGSNRYIYEGTMGALSFNLGYRYYFGE